MIYALEEYSEVVEEIKPLLLAHHEEIVFYKDELELDPDYDLYKLGQETGILKVFTMRSGGGPKEKGTLVGYNIFFVHTHPHYKQDIFADNDMVYIDPAHRHTGDTIAFFEWCERQLKENNVHVITYHMNTLKTFSSLMNELDMDLAQHMYMKYIG